jgi:phosphatidylserine decarboxylase
MGTPSGFAVFLDPTVNAVFKKILDQWGQYLQSPLSTSHLQNDADYSWMSSKALSELAKTANAPYQTSLEFKDLFICDPSKPCHGFKSWDDFFIRHFKEDVRPVVEPTNNDLLANPCESQPYQVARDVKIRDHFWLKSQPYSITDMLDHDPRAKEFEGGTIYQAFLSALSYHRWHTPCSGTIKDIHHVPGTYYSEPLFAGTGDPDNKGKIDAEGEETGQGYISATAARAIIYIEADNPKLGLLVFIAIGMSEVSSNDVTVQKGQHVKKGAELGMFHFGGSSFTLLFRKGVNVSDFPSIPHQGNVAVRGKLAMVE